MLGHACIGRRSLDVPFWFYCKYMLLPYFLFLSFFLFLSSLFSFFLFFLFPFLPPPSKCRPGRIAPSTPLGTPLFSTVRSQRVVIDNVLSNPIAGGRGVVQGSVLGPLIFILFINDIVDCLDTDEVNPTTCCIFGNDMKLLLLCEAATDSSSLSNTLKNIENRSHKWQLLINPEKSLLLQFGRSKHDRPVYFICDKLIAPSDLIRDLGITYDSKLCFHDYINEIAGRAYHRVNLLFRSFVSQNVSISTSAFLTYVRPILEYCTSIWSPPSILFN